jgi:hypothetical protein
MATPILLMNSMVNIKGLCFSVAKAGGLQSPGVKGEVVAVYLESLTTQDLKFSGFPEG